MEEAICDVVAAELLLPDPLVGRIGPKGPSASDVIALFYASQASREACCVKAAQTMRTPGYVMLADLTGTALFTAAAQPPLVAFGVGIITLYTVNADRASASLKSLILQVLLPIADVFPWLAITFLVTLALVVARWYVTKKQSPAESSTPRTKASKRSSSDTREHTRSARKATDKRSTKSDVQEAASGEQTIVMSGRGRSRRSRPRPGGDAAPTRSARTESPARSGSAKTRSSPARTPAAGGQRRATAGQVSRAAAKSFIPGSPADERTEAFETPKDRP